MYTTRVARPRDIRPRHAVENQWDLLTAIGVPAPEADRNPVEMPVDPQAAAAVTTRLQAAELGAGDRLIVVHVSAGNPFRRWPQDAFAAMVSSLVSRHRLAPRH